MLRKWAIDINKCSHSKCLTVLNKSVSLFTHTYKEKNSSHGFLMQWKSYLQRKQLLPAIEEIYKIKESGCVSVALTC